MRKLPSLLIVVAASCASSVPSSNPDASDRDTTEDAPLDADSATDGDNREGSISALDAALDTERTFDSRGDGPDIEQRDDAYSEDSTDSVSPPDVSGPTADAPAFGDAGDGGRECENWNARYACSAFFGVNLAVDPGADFSCCRGRCVIGGCCLDSADCGGSRNGCSRDPCDPWAGNVCCYQNATRTLRCVPRNSGYCERRL